MTPAATALGPHEPLRLRLLSSFELTCRGAPVELPHSAKRLVAFLGIQDRPVERLSVAGRLWLDASEARSYANLRSTLWRVRRTGHEVVQARGPALHLAPSVSVDVRETVALAQRVLTSRGGADEVAAPLSLTDDLLPDWYDDWVEIERERLRQLRLHALEALAERMLAAGRYGEATEACLAAFRTDRLRESACRVLIRVHLAEGNWSEAIRQYNLYTRLLRKQLGLQPSPQLRELMLAIPRAERPPR